MKPPYDTYLFLTVLVVIYRHVAVELDRASRVTPGED
jgi:hypothetical protein